MDHLREQADVHEPTVGARPSGSPRAEALAARLAVLTGNPPRVTVDGVRTRIEVDLPHALSETAQHLLYQALADLDDRHRGYEAGDSGRYVWAELLELPDPARLNPDQRAGYACALCGTGLYASRFLGSIGGAQLYACSPVCPTLPLARG